MRGLLFLLFLNSLQHRRQKAAASALLAVLKGFQDAGRSAESSITIDAFLIVHHDDILGDSYTASGNQVTSEVPALDFLDCFQ